MGIGYAVGGAAAGSVSGGLVHAGADMVGTGPAFAGNTCKAAMWGGVGAGTTMGIAGGAIGEARGYHKGYNKGFKDGQDGEMSF